MTFYLFIDESGDHGLQKLNHEFPLFVLCGILVEQFEYSKIRDSFNSIKNQFWGNTNVIFHSRDIRKCEKDFVTLLNSNTKKLFYEELNQAIIENEYTVVASAINKIDYVKAFGEFHNNVYELALTAVFNQILTYLFNNKLNAVIDVVIEKRGKKEDRKLEEHFKYIQANGTEAFSAQQIASCKISIRFKDKKENVNGLQLADLIAYPIAKYVIDSTEMNIAFHIFKNKIYKYDGEFIGLKIIP